MLADVKMVLPYVFNEKNRNKVIGSIAIDVLATILNIAPLVIISEHSDTLSNEDNDEFPLVLSGLGAALIVAQLLPKVRSILIDSVRTNVQKELTCSMVKKSFEIELDEILTTPIDQFSDAMYKNYGSVDKGLPVFFSSIIPFAFEALAITIALCIINDWIGVVPPVVLSLYIPYCVYRENQAKSIREECGETSRIVYGEVVQTISNYTIAHQFGNVNYELQKINQPMTRSEDLYRKNYITDDITALHLSIINSIGFIGGLGLAVFAPPNGKLDLTTFLLTAYFLFRINIKLETLSQSISAFNAAIIDFKKIVNFLNRKSPILKTDSFSLKTTSPLDIEFRDINFSYGNRRVLNNINFKVNSGKKVAVVGATGVGKSSLLKLLQDFYQPECGEIFISGMPLRNILSESLRSHVAVVAQDSIMFDGSIKDNIRYGDFSASDEDIYHAALFAGLIDENDRNRLDDPVGQQGGRLSGEEKQRIAIARALLHCGNAYLLDEATSALDAATEKEVQKTLDDLTAGATVLVVTHRYSTVINADLILYLENGAIVEHGTFTQLMQLQGRFFDKFKTQCQGLGLSLDDFRMPQPRSTITNSQFSVWHQQRKIRKRSNLEGNALSYATTEQQNTLFSPLIRK